MMVASEVIRIGRSRTRQAVSGRITSTPMNPVGIAETHKAFIHTLHHAAQVDAHIGRQFGIRDGSSDAKDLAEIELRKQVEQARRVLDNAPPQQCEAAKQVLAALLRAFSQLILEGESKDKRNPLC